MWQAHLSTHPGLTSAPCAHPRSGWVLVKAASETVSGRWYGGRCSNFDPLRLLFPCTKAVHTWRECVTAKYDLVGIDKGLRLKQ